MNSNLKTILGVGGLIVVAAAVGAGLFLFTGFQEGIWFTVAGIPIVVVAGVAMYVRGVISRGSTSEQQYVRKRGRGVAEDFQTHLRDLRDLENTYPRWSPTVDAQVESIADDFGRQGVDFDLETGSFEMRGAVEDADVQEFERLESEIDAFRSEYVDEFVDFVETEFDWMREGRNRLNDAGVVSDDGRVVAPSDGTVAGYRDSLEAARSDTDEVLTDAMDQVREMSRGETRPGDVDSIEAELDQAADAMEANDYRRAVEAILEARDQLRDQLSGSFSEERDALSDLVETVRASDVDRHVDAEYVEDVEEVGRAIDSLDSGLDLAELTRHRSTLRRTCIDMIASMEGDLDDAAATLRDADLPPGYYSEPGIAGETFIDELGDIDDLDAFTDRWETVADELVDALDTAKTKAAVVEAYDDVADTIETKLQSTGTVTGDDLPVRHGDQFLGLYYRRNDGVEFDPETATLRRGSVATHDVTIELAYARGGDARRATVDLEGGGYAETAVAETHVATTVTFEDVPEGTYTLRADPGDESFAGIEREITVDADQTRSVEFAERSLRDRVCAETDADMDAHLSEIGQRLASRFESEGYLSTAMDLPVRDEHAPCLVATWAEENGHAAAAADGDVVAYDRQDVAREIENVVRYNLEEGDSLSFDGVRSRFLSVPVPDAVLRDVVAGLETDRDVRTTDSTITVE
ncbi:MAG: hypothetical protein ABEJ76_03525 [Halanaeroarchaeum sp.]